MSKQDFVIGTWNGIGIAVESASDREFLSERYKPGTQLKTIVSQPRSLKHHNLYWSVLRRIVQITGGQPWPNAEALDYAVKIQLRMFGEGVRLFNGEVRFEVQSISFSAMDQGAFKLYFETAIDAIGETTLIDMAEVIDDVKHNIGWSQADQDKFNGKSARG